MKNEECWILKGSKGRWWWNAKFDRYTTGLPASVAFDYNYVLQDDSRVVGWIHSHPSWTAYPSNTDDSTMKSWTICLGRPLVCCILGTDGLRAWWYCDDERREIQGGVRMMGKRIFGYIPRKVIRYQREKQKGKERRGEKICA